MGKKSFSKHVNDVRVIAVPSRVIKDRKGNAVKQLYDIYQKIRELNGWQNNSNIIIIYGTSSTLIDILFLLFIYKNLNMCVARYQKSFLFCISS